MQIEELAIYSNANDRATRSTAVNLMRMREALAFVTRLKVRSSIPTRIYIFGDERSFAPYADAVMGRSAHLSGVFLTHRDGNHVMIQSGTAAGDRVIYHELAHYFLRNTVSGVPLWFNEGIAEFYSTFAVSGDSVQVGLPVQEHVAWLRQQQLIPLKDLFAITTASREYNEGNRQGVFYAESWALVHYLMIGNPDRRDQFGTFLGLLLSKRPVDEAFRTAFKASYEDLERELRRYVRALSMNYVRYSLADLHSAEPPAPQPVSRDVLLVNLADLLVHGRVPDFADAEIFISDALKGNPSNGDAYAELGYIKFLQRDRPASNENFEKAIQLGSRSEVPYLMYADSILLAVDESMRRNAGAPSDQVQKARALYRKAIELNPAAARAYAGLGATYVVTTEEPQPGIEAFERALALAPGQNDVIFNLLILQARAGRRDDASRLADILAQSADPETVRQARENVLVADLRRSDELIRQGKRAEAVALMKSVASQTSNEQLKTQIASALSSLAESDAAQAQFDQFKRAVEKAEAGKYQEALSLVDALIPQITDQRLLDTAKEFRAKVVEYAGRKKH